jgi:hypothetical protein
MRMVNFLVMPLSRLWFIWKLLASFAHDSQVQHQKDLGKDGKYHRGLLYPI